jgi:hypothetical protein
MHGGGTQVNQETIRSKHALGFVEGMDHALLGNSSQHPGEHHHVERFAGMVDPLGLTHLKVDSPREPLRQIPARRAKKLGVWVTRVHHGA